MCRGSNAAADRRRQHTCVAAALTLMPKTTAASDSQHLVPSYCASTRSQGPSEACKRPIVPLGTRWDSLPAPSQVGWSVFAIYIATSCACQRCRQLAALACCRLCSPRQSRSRCIDHRLLTLVAHPIRYVTRPVAAAAAARCRCRCLNLAAASAQHSSQAADDPHQMHSR